VSPNVDLLQRTLAHIEAHPEQWDQNHWGIETDCGTAYCFAGAAVVLSDLPLDWDLDEDEFGDPEITANMIGEGAPEGFRFRSIRWVAKELLGLNEGQSDKLFHAHNTLDDLRHIVAELIDGAPEQLSTEVTS